jgi:hypothetical protein
VFQEIISPRDRPEAAGGAIIDIEAEEPIGEAVVSNRVDSITPLPEKDKVVIESLRQAELPARNPGP